MEVSEFQRILNLGLGRAILYLQRNPASRSLYRDAILYACLNNTAFDPQSEGDRTEYLTEVIELSGEREYYEDQILREFARLDPSYDTLWTAEQFFNFGLWFAQAGNGAARQLLYQKYKQGWDAGHSIGADELVSLDGIKGFLFATDPLNTQTYPEQDAWKYTILLENLEARLDIDEHIRTHYSDNPQLQRFIDAIRSSASYGRKRLTPVQKTKSAIENKSYDEIRQQGILKSGKTRSFYDWVRWGDQASEEDLVLAAEDFLREEASDRILLYLNIFQRRPFPLDPTRLLHFAEYGEPRDERDFIAIRAINALKNLALPEVRQLALRMIEQNNFTGHAVGLLQNNFEKGDWQFIEEVSTRTLEPEDLHDLGFSVRAIFKLHPSKGAAGALVNLYEYGPCSMCRKHFVELLHDLSGIPDWMAEECQYDSNPHLRAYTRQGFENIGEQN